MITSYSSEFGFWFFFFNGVKEGGRGIVTLYHSLNNKPLLLLPLIRFLKGLFNFIGLSNNTGIYIAFFFG